MSRTAGNAANHLPLRTLRVLLLQKEESFKSAAAAAKTDFTTVHREIRAKQKKSKTRPAYFFIQLRLM